ncbi:MAG: DUF1552 domain-containing protein [Planctomycetaceae bacterium]
MDISLTSSASQRSPFLSRRISRRHLLRGSGVVCALPLLECMNGGLADEHEPRVPRRMLLISNNLGVLPKPFFPETTGRDYSLSPYLSLMAENRNEFTVFSGLSHPAVHGGHSTENCFLTAARGPTRSGFRNSISLDQFAAQKLGPITRFSTLNLGVNIDKANRSLSWTRDGVLLPAEDSAPALFRRMFVQGNPDEVARQLHRLDERGSILDTLLQDAGRLNRRIGVNDRQRMDQYFSSVRDVEHRLEAAREWETRPRPTANREAPQEIADVKLLFARFELMLSMAQLAFQVDATRIVTLMVDAFATPVFTLSDDRNTTDGYHNLSHHGQAEEKLRQLEDADRQQMRLLNELIKGFAGIREHGERLLDRTSILFGSNMGDSNTHDNTNLPILLAGGGFKHGQHLAFNRENNTPLSNLFVSMLQRMEIEADQFGSSTSSISV